LPGRCGLVGAAIFREADGDAVAAVELHLSEAGLDFNLIGGDGRHVPNDFPSSFKEISSAVAGWLTARQNERTVMALRPGVGISTGELSPACSEFETGITHPDLRFNVETTWLSHGYAVLETLNGE
jgi:hypothetical protein